MKVITALLISILPGFLLGKFIYDKDKDKEPKRILLEILLFSVLMFVPIVVLEKLFSYVFPTADTIFSYLFKYVVGVALIEEIGKFIVAYVIGVKSKFFDDVYDAIVYTTFASIGFAVIENFFYVFSNGLNVGIIRAITAITGHIAYGILMGYFIGIAYKEKADQNTRKYKANMIYCLLVPVLYHGLYDFAIMYGVVTSNISAIVLIIVTDLFLIMYAFNELMDTSDKNESIPKNTNSERVIVIFLTFEIVLAISLIMIFSLNFSTFNNMLNIYNVKDKIHIKEDNITLIVDSYEEVSDSYIKVDFKVENKSNYPVTINQSNFVLNKIKNKKISQLKYIDFNDSFPIVIPPKEYVYDSIYFEAEEKTNSEYVLEYSSRNLSKEYGIILENY